MLFRVKVVGVIGRDDRKRTKMNATPKKEFEPYRGKIRKSGTGCVTMINDHLYEGRFTPRVGGKRISKNVHAKTQEECEEKLTVLIAEMKAEIKAAKERKKNADDLQK